MILSTPPTRCKLPVTSTCIVAVVASSESARVPLFSQLIASSMHDNTSVIHNLLSFNCVQTWRFCSHRLYCSSSSWFRFAWSECLSIFERICVGQKIAMLKLQSYNCTHNSCYIWNDTSKYGSNTSGDRSAVQWNSNTRTTLSSIEAVESNLIWFDDS